eukprot:scaffold5559_cov51-Prasinocladus_malaysianus.AAC.2
MSQVGHKRQGLSPGSDDGRQAQDSNQDGQGQEPAHFLRHVDSTKLLRSHPPKQHASPLGPMRFKAGERGDDCTRTTENNDEEPGTVDGTACKAEPRVDPITDKPMSKNQMKKLLKKQKIEETKAKRKQKEKEARVAQQAQKKADKEAMIAGMTPGECHCPAILPVALIELQQRPYACYSHVRRKAQELEAYRAGAKSKKAERKSGKEDVKTRLKEAMVSGQRIVIDLDFEDKMKENEMRSLCQQISYSYSANRGARHPCHLYLTSYKARAWILQSLLSPGAHNDGCSHLQHPLT